MDNDKEFYRLWFEYLKRNETYKELCKWMRITHLMTEEHEVDFTDQYKKLCEQMRREDISIQLPDKFTVILKDVVFANFGDIFTIDFDEWWKNRENRKRPKVLEEYVTSEALPLVEADLDYCIWQFEQKHGRKPSAIELKQCFVDYLRRQLPSHRFIKLSLMDEPKAIKHELAKFMSSNSVQETIKEMKSALKLMKMLYTKPTGKPRLDDLKTYLDVYDMWKERIESKKSSGPGEWRKIIQHFEPNRHDFNESVERRYQRYKQKAEAIISNVEAGDFPGET